MTCKKRLTTICFSILVHLCSSHMVQIRFFKNFCLNNVKFNVRLIVSFIPINKVLNTKHIQSKTLGFQKEQSFYTHRKKTMTGYQTTRHFILSQNKYQLICRNVSLHNRACVRYLKPQLRKQYFCLYTYTMYVNLNLL